MLSYIKNTSKTSISDFRNEVYEKTQRHFAFQISSYGRISLGFDELPNNDFSNMTPSLFLMIYNDHFTFSSAVPGFNIIGNINDDEGIMLLNCISRGFLVPNSLKILKELNLTWYDGYLICEIVDNRRVIPKTLRTNLKPTSNDIASCGFENEQAFLLAQYPLLCLEPDTKVAELSRTIVNDKNRWQVNEISCDSPIVFVSRRKPELLINHQKSIERKDDENEIDFKNEMMKRIMSMANGQ